MKIGKKQIDAVMDNVLIMDTGTEDHCQQSAEKWRQPEVEGFSVRVVLLHENIRQQNGILIPALWGVMVCPSQIRV